MDRITIRGIHAFGHHGVLEHERRFGQRFVVDIVVYADLRDAGRNDQLDATVDYSAIVTAAVQVATGEPFNLLEAVADRIAQQCLTHARVEAVEVTVHKPSAPVAAAVEDIAVTVRRQRT